jgi:sarcosine/dimethylglycine N-methyltransferase
MTISEVGAQYSTGLTRHNIEQALIAALRALVEEAGLVVELWNDLTDDAGALMKVVSAQPPGPLGVHTYVDNFTEKARHLTEGLASGRLRVIQGLARGVG